MNELTGLPGLQEVLKQLRLPKFTKIEFTYSDAGWSYCCSGINQTMAGSYYPRLVDAIETMIKAYIEAAPEEFNE